MDRERTPREDAVQRAVLDYWFDRRASESAAREPRAQQIPVNVYDTGEDIVVVAPMPGVEAENIDVEVLGTTVTLRASLRGAGQADRHYLLHEWTYGPYERSITLPVDVDAQQANASHGNGVLVLSLPKARHAQAVRVPLQQKTSARAGHQGHSGHHTESQELE